MNRRGFTLVELVIVIVVIGILSFVTTAAITTVIKSIQLNSAADKLVSDIRYAHTMANVTATWYGVSFEVNPVNRYSIFTTNTTGTIDTIVNNPAKNGTAFTINLKSDYNVLISGVTIEGGGKKILFQPLGTPYMSTSSIISSESVVTLYLGATKTIRITRNTGRIYKQ